MFEIAQNWPDALTFAANSKSNFYRAPDISVFILKYNNDRHGNSKYKTPNSTLVARFELSTLVLLAFVSHSSVARSLHLLFSLV